MRKSDTDLRQLDSDLLRSFLAVARAGSLSGAADGLLRTQSAVSLQMQKLEDVIGQQLFTRHGRGVALTAGGEKLLPVARQVVETLDQAMISLRDVHSPDEIRFGIPEEYGDTLLPSILSRFSEEQPGARILLRCGSSADFPAALSCGELDLALHTPAIVTKQDVVIRREMAVWAGSAYHDVEKRRPLPCRLVRQSMLVAGALSRPLAKGRAELRDRLHERECCGCSRCHIGRVCSRRSAAEFIDRSCKTPCGYRTA